MCPRIKSIFDDWFNCTFRPLLSAVKKTNKGIKVARCLTDYLWAMRAVSSCHQPDFLHCFWALALPPACIFKTDPCSAESRESAESQILGPVDWLLSRNVMLENSLSSQRSGWLWSTFNIWLTIINLIRKWTNRNLLLLFSVKDGRGIGTVLNLL